MKESGVVPKKKVKKKVFVSREMHYLTIVGAKFKKKIPAITLH